MRILLEIDEGDEETGEEFGVETGDGQMVLRETTAIEVATKIMTAAELDLFLKWLRDHNLLP